MPSQHVMQCPVDDKLRANMFNPTGCQDVITMHNAILSITARPTQVGGPCIAGNFEP